VFAERSSISAFNCAPPHNLVHFVQELLAPRLALLASVIRPRKAALLHANIIATPNRIADRACSDK
jgi:hypothetical protein